MCTESGLLYIICGGASVVLSLHIHAFRMSSFHGGVYMVFERLS